MSNCLRFILIASLSAGLAQVDNRQIVVHIPTKLRLADPTGERMLEVDPANPEIQTLSVDAGTTTGVEVRYRHYWDGSPRSEEPRAGVLVDRTDFAVGGWSNGLLHDRKQTLEAELIVFQTDVPKQQPWSPKDSPKYKVLLHRVLTLDYQPPPIAPGDPADPHHDPFVGFPQPPPRASADPSRRRDVIIQVPTRLKLQRDEQRLSVSVDARAFEPATISVGTDMVLGVRTETRVYPQDQPRPVDAGVWGLSGLNFGTSGTHFYNRNEAGIPAPAVAYIVEKEFVLFETDIPPQHLWSPGGPKTKDIWRRNIKQVVP